MITRYGEFGERAQTLMFFLFRLYAKTRHNDLRHCRKFVLCSCGNTMHMQETQYRIIYRHCCSTIAQSKQLREQR